MINKEKPPATTRERLAAVEDALGTIAHQYPVEYVDDDNSGEPAVYVNYDFNTAIVITVVEQGDPEGYNPVAGMFSVDALHWAPDHGIDDEHHVGYLADADVAAQVAVQFARSRESM